MMSDLLPLDPDSAAVPVLYVDDEEMACKYFQRAVGRDFKVFVAAGAEQAIAMLGDESLSIGILVTDYRMPERDGVSLLRQVEQELPHVVRVLVTAYADREVLLESINSGEVFRILEKPLDMRQVTETLQLAVELARERNARQQRLDAMDETLGFLAHELNTPLAAITHFSQGIQTRMSNGDDALGKMSVEIAAAASRIDAGAKYCLSLLASFVNSIRLASIDLHGPHLTAHRLASSLLDTYPLTHAQRGAIRLDVEEDFGIAALPNCVMLVLSSILSNALRAVADHGQPEILISIAVRNHPQIRISNNGPHIPPEVLKKLTQVPFTSHSESGGSGWGLVFCKRIMESFGGSLQIASAPPSDTAMTLHFPSTGVSGTG